MPHRRVSLDAPVAPRPDGVTEGQYARVLMAVGYLNRHYHDHALRLDAVAYKAARMSPAHLSRLFKAVMGQTCRDYLHGLRVAKAVALLQSSGLNVSEIAVAVGFMDLTSFCRAFKKTTGLPASYYRRQARGSGR